MPSRRPLVAGNWKLHGSQQSNDVLLQGIVAGLPGLTGAEIVVCPPFVYLAAAALAARGSVLRLGAQDVAAEESGAFTGEVSAAMLRDVGCEYVIVGHSERRALYGETDALAARKVAAAARAGLKPILCVGETLQERDANQAAAVVRRQLAAVLDQVDATALASLLVAYEPVWAIGTGRTATPVQAQEIHQLIRVTAAERDATMAAGLRILYGGSVKASNATELFAMPDIDGGLIGGASLNAAEFLDICRAAASRT